MHRPHSAGVEDGLGALAPTIAPVRAKRAAVHRLVVFVVLFDELVCGFGAHVLSFTARASVANSVTNGFAETVFAVAARIALVRIR